MLSAAVVAVAVASPPADAAPAPAPGARAGFAGRVLLPDGRRMYLECRGTGRPTVMLEAGHRAAADVWSTPARPGQIQPTVFPALARTTRVCMYDRPGTVRANNSPGRSSPVRMPRATGAAVADLRALQRAARIPGPYVLAGWSAGGLIARQYTSTYPRSVAGLVMVEAIAEAIEFDLTVSRWNHYNTLLTEVPRSLAGHLPNLETLDFRQSFAQMRRVGVRPPRRIPYIVLQRGRPAGAPGSFGPILERAWAMTQRYLARLQPGTPRLISPRSGHNMPIEDPRLVIDATRRVITAVRRGHGFTGAARSSIR